MERSRFLETVVGAIVLMIALLFMWKAYSTTDIGDDFGDGHYTIGAKFSKVDGLNLGSDVKVGGIKIGKVVSMDLDPKTFDAIVKFKIKDSIKLPVDTTAEIIGGSLLGDKYVSLDPGFEEQKIPDNGFVEYTQSSISLESLIGKFMFSSAEKAAKTDDKASEDAKASK